MASNEDENYEDLSDAEETMASTFDSFSMRQQRQHMLHVATHLRRLTPHFLAAITPSVVSHTRRTIVRDHEHGYNNLWNRYFRPDAMYTETMFRRRFYDERHSNLETWRPEQTKPQSSSSYEAGDPDVVGAYLSARTWVLRDRDANHRLKTDLIEHMWNRVGLEDGD
ncbi:hypothetical protein Dimus_011379 [Dionaea muscipula]